MEIPLLSEFLELIQKIDFFQNKAFEKNKFIGVISLKAMIKVLEKLLTRLKEKESELLGENLEELIKGVNIKKIKDFILKK